MSGEGFDGCECTIWNHEFAMRRLLSLWCLMPLLFWLELSRTNQNECKQNESTNVPVNRPYLYKKIIIKELRQGQAYCTDGECLDELPGLGPPNGSNGFLMMFLMMAFAMLLYVMRPSRLRNDDLDGKPYNGGQGPSGAPPTPPPAAN